MALKDPILPGAGASANEAHTKELGAPWPDMCLDWTSGQLEALAAMSAPAAVPEVVRCAVRERLDTYVRALPRSEYRAAAMLALGAWRLTKLALRGMGPGGVVACLLAGWAIDDLVARHLPGPAAPAEMPADLEFELLTSVENPSAALREGMRAAWRGLASAEPRKRSALALANVGRAVAPGPTRLVTTLASLFVARRR